ncbi:MAG: hypothetical protein D5S01_04255 [Halanaerobium sp. MSAO_Bac5]|nr:MAG: hypothetical protein D5S01_04255 [Halanaerobium sp. MSAO_Bac5]
MAKNKEEYQLRYIYHTNQYDDAYLIELELDQYCDLYNAWDGSALDRKALDPGLSNFLERASFELPLEEKVEICFYLPEEKKDESKEADARATIKNNFRMDIFFLNRKLDNNKRKISYYFLLGIAFILTAYLIPENQDLSLLVSLLQEGLFIGSWVFMWEASSLFFFSTKELKDKKKRYLRYLSSEIIFNYY